MNSTINQTLTASTLRSTVQEVVNVTPILDIHTHLYPPSFRSLSLWGINEVVTYHYLIAELFRSSPIRPSHFWNLNKQGQADLIWETLFVRNTPISEATRGVVNVMKALGLDPSASDLTEARAFFASRDHEAHVREVLRIANVSEVVMTNDVFDDAEVSYWNDGASATKQFHAVLRMDPLLNQWPTARVKLRDLGYAVDDEVTDASAAHVRRFLDDWIKRMKPLYMAVSLPPTFQFPEDSMRGRMLTEVVLPTCRAHNLPFAMMIGVRKQVHPALRDAGDSLGHADIRSVERICLDSPDNRFLVTMLSRENQHELCVAARKFSNLMPFGCWWFLNNPSIIAEITAERLEMLGATFIPQHSDARILEQVIYKWDHSRRIIAEALENTYAALVRDGGVITRAHIERDVYRLVQGNFRSSAGL
jgi:hypothetical protein